MQSKLVEGIGDKRNKGADSIVPQKHTPLELQVVELKKKYPDILLIIEVSLPSAMQWHVAICLQEGRATLR